MADEATGPHVSPVSGEVLGPLVHLTRLKHDAQQAAKEGRERFRLGDWDQRPEHQQDLDIAIAGAIAEVVTAAVRGRLAARMDDLAGNYPEDVFPPDGTSRDAIGGTAMRYAYRNAAREIREADLA